jgi:hypothetical protein
VVAILPPLIVASGFGLYMATNTLLGRFRRVPWEFLAISAFGVALGLVLALRDSTPAHITGAAVGSALFGFLIWFFFRFSMYGAREDLPRVGDRFPEFRLPASDGTTFDFTANRGKRHLLIFYRGSW